MPAFHLGRDNGKIVTLFLTLFSRKLCLSDCCVTNACRRKFAICPIKRAFSSYFLCASICSRLRAVSELRSCVKVEAADPDSPSLLVFMVSVDVQKHWTRVLSELRSCVKVEAADLDSPSLLVFMVSVDVQKHWTRVLSELRSCVKVEAADLDSPSLLVFMVSVDVQKHNEPEFYQNSGAVWKSKRPTWTPRPY